MKNGQNGKENGKKRKQDAHLWKPGQSGNPKGRPKKRTLSEELRDFIDQEMRDAEGNGKGITHRQALARVIVKQALSGKFPFVKEIFDRLEGKVADRTEITGPSGEPIEILDLSSKGKRESFYRLLSSATDGGDKRSGSVRYNGE